MPRRLGHVLFFTPDPVAAERFYTGLLGFRSRTGCRGCSRSCAARPTTTRWRFGNRAIRGFHHASYEVGSFDEVGMGGMWMRERGWQPAWGLGRHAIGSNVFYYIRDPWGSYAEYFTTSTHIPRGRGVGSARMGPKYALYCWGPDVPGDFIENKRSAGGLVVPIR